jgi:phospholipid/cholesterol/gamma-HCH transport system substrate-binding protein
MPSARRVTWAKIRVTAVTLAALAILLVLCSLLTGGTLFQRESTLYLYIPDGAGLAPGSLVRVDGVDIGKVVSVHLSGSNQPGRAVRVVLTVKTSRLKSVTADSTAEISSETLIGDKYVDISSGRSPNAIRPGTELTFKSSGINMKSLDLTQFEDQLRKVATLLDQIEGGRTQLGQFILGDQMYRDLLHNLDRLQAGINQAVNTTGSVGRLLYTDASWNKIAQPLASLDQALARIQNGPWMRDRAKYDELLKTVSDLRQSLAKVRGGSLFQSDALYVEWNRRVNSLIATVDNMNASPLFSSSSAYDNLNGMARRMTDTVRDFREHPKKYLRMKVF